MAYKATTPFGQRAVTSALIERVAAANQKPVISHANKWELFRELTVAKSVFGVSDRELTVLNALLSFHPQTNLSDNDQMIVFPSNVALSERAHGMAESTLRRHLAALVKAGLILRNDSPNGKRYAMRGHEAAIYGFDLRPMLVMADQIVQSANAVRDAQMHHRKVRSECSVMLRDAEKLALYLIEQGVSVDQFVWALADHRRALRRKNSIETLEQLHGQICATLRDIKRHLSDDSEKIIGNDIQFERHHQNTNTETLDSEPFQEMEMGAADIAQTPTDSAEPNIPIGLVVKACPDLPVFAQRDVRNWHDLVVCAAYVRGMLGISADAWDEAQFAMGPETAAITVACILQRAAQIHNPGGYLRSLTRKAKEKAFSPGPMVMALLSPQGQG